jgi:membrane protease YdiL (CAAX protease family)
MKTIQKPLIPQGWLKALIYFLVVSLIVYVFQIAGSFVMNEFKPGSETGDNSVLAFGVFYAVMGIFIIIFTGLMRRFIDRKSFESLGFARKGYSNEAGLGFFSALGLLGIGSMILVTAGYLSFIAATFNAGSLLLEIAIMMVVAFVEELIFRGYLLNNLMQSMNKWGALSITAALFSLFHGSNPDVTLFAVINIFLAGVLLGINYIFTKNLWFSIFFHFAWNYFQGPILGYDVSGLKLTSLLQQSVSGSETWTGGPFGFEGSLLCPLLFIVAIIVFAFAFNKRYKQQTL